RETIQPVLVEPKLAPRITPIELLKLSKPAETEPIVAMVVTLEDCTNAGRESPVGSVFDGEPVNRCSQLIKEWPASAFKPSVIKIMPSRNRPIPPSRFEMMLNIMMKF